MLSKLIAESKSKYHKPILAFRVVSQNKAPKLMNFSKLFHPTLSNSDIIKFFVQSSIRPKFWHYKFLARIYQLSPISCTLHSSIKRKSMIHLEHRTHASPISLSLSLLLLSLFFCNSCTVSSTNAYFFTYYPRYILMSFAAKGRIRKYAPHKGWAACSNFKY